MLKRLRNIYGLSTLLAALAFVVLSPIAAHADSPYDRLEKSDYSETTYSEAQFEPTFADFIFYASSDRLAREQKGDTGMTWAVAGPKDFDSKVARNANLPAGEEYIRPRGAKEQYQAVMADLRESCRKGPAAAYCVDQGDAWLNYAYSNQGLIESFFNHSIDYRTGTWIAGYSIGPVWVIHLEDINGGLPWVYKGADDANGERNYNYGSNATVGKMKDFIRQQIASPAGSDYYRYMMQRGLMYLDLIYGSRPDSYPIEYLAIPREPENVCLEVVPGYNPYRDMRPIFPTVWMGAGATAWARAKTCPANEDGHWEYTYESEIGMVPSGDAGKINGPLQLQTTIEDDSPTGVGSLPFDRQRESRLTPLGEKINEFCEAKGGCTTDIQFTNAEWKALKEAAEASQDATSPKIDLTANNVRALSQGRLTAVSEQLQDVLITRSSSQDRYMRRWIATKTYYDERGNTQGTTTTAGDWEWAQEPDKDRAANNATFEMGTLHFLNGYQIIINHCDGEVFDSTVGDHSIDNRQITSSDLEGSYLAGSAVSDTYTDPSKRPWGQTGPTSTASFFDKVCSYEGTRTDVETENPVGSSDDSKPYAIFPRHGEGDPFKVAYYTPTEGGWVDYLQDSPTGFTSTRWEDGTPQAGNYFWLRGMTNTGTQTGGLFTSQRGETAPVLTQWGNTSTYNTNDVVSAAGHFKYFETRGIWASEKAQPQTLTMKWDFKPEIATMTPITDIGFTRSGESSYHKEVVGAEVRGQVYSRHGEDTTSPAFRDEYLKHTGSDSVNKLDVPLYFGSDLDADKRWVTRPDKYSDYYYGVQYVRSTTE